MLGGVCESYKLTISGLATGLTLLDTGGGFSEILAYMLAGAMVTLVYGFIAITFPIRFIDVIVRMALVSIITPFLVVAATFKPTRGYAMIGVSIILNAAAQFALLVIILKIGSQVFLDFERRMIVEAGDNSTVGSVLITALVLTAIALIFAGLIKAVPSIAAELTRSSSGGGEGGSGAMRAVGGAATIAATGGATAGALAVKGGAAAGRVTGRMAANRLGRATTKE